MTPLDVYESLCSSPPQSKLRIALLNAHSVCNKSAVIYNLILENSLDILCLIETWINNGDISSSLLSSLLPPNYDLAQYYGRPISVYGGGIAIIKHNSINLTPIKTDSFFFFKCIGSVITSSYSAFKLFVIYFPPSSSISTFFTEFESLIECHISSNIDLFFFGDFNIKINNNNDYNTQHFNKLLHNFNLSQYVSFLTHGHILDLIITNDSSKLNIHPFYIDICTSNHKTICVDLYLPKLFIKKKAISYR